MVDFLNDFFILKLQTNFRLKMKKKFNLQILICLFLSLISSQLFSIRSNSPFEIETIFYENIDDQIRANINLNNGYQFIFAPKIEEEYMLEDLETHFCSGRKVIIWAPLNTQKYMLSIVDSALDGALNFKELFFKDISVSLSKKTVRMLPSFQEIEQISTGWFSKDSLHITLSDGTKWKCILGDYNVKNWRKGQRILFSQDISHLTGWIELINIDANYKDRCIWGTIIPVSE